MKYFLLSISLFLCLAFPMVVVAQNQPQKTANFIKIWGFLKYYHPTVATGKIDWDQRFMTGLQEISALNSKKELNAYYLSWIEKLGNVERCGNCKLDVPGSEKFNVDMGWLRDSTNFDSELITKLTYIQKNRNQKENFYVSRGPGISEPNFSKEKSYPDSIFPSAEMRLLTLSRYWNIINYFFPYRYQTTQPWNSVLDEMIPKFLTAKDTTAYHLAIVELTAKIDDSHAKFASTYTEAHFGLKWVPFKFKIIENKAVVTGFYNDSLSKANDIRIGDAFLTVEGNAIERLISTNLKYIGASNASAKLRDIHQILFHGNTSEVDTEVERNGLVVKKTIQRYNFKDLKYERGQDSPKDTVRLLDGNIGYVNMGNLTIKQVPLLISKLKSTKAIIFDVRNYPKGTLYEVANFLTDKPKAFVKATVSNPTHPGTFTFSKEIFIGKNNKDPYKGKVILLCNESTQSHAEFTLMALQTAPNVTVVGSQTSGADGNVSTIILPGNLKTYMTGLGVFYPDGRETQRIGIVPNIIIQPTIKGIREGIDEVMEKALETVGK